MTPSFSMKIKGLPHKKVTELVLLSTIKHINVVGGQAGKVDAWVQVENKAEFMEFLRGFGAEAKPDSPKQRQQQRKKTSVVILQVVSDSKLTLTEVDVDRLRDVFNKKCRTQVKAEQVEFTNGKKGKDGKKDTSHVASVYLQVASNEEAERIVNMEKGPLFCGTLFTTCNNEEVSLHAYQLSTKPYVYRRDKHVKGKGKQDKWKMQDCGSSGSESSYGTACDSFSNETMISSQDYAWQQDRMPEVVNTCMGHGGWYETGTSYTDSFQYCFTSPPPSYTPDLSFDTSCAIEPVQEPVQEAVLQEYVNLMEYYENLAEMAPYYE